MAMPDPSEQCTGVDLDAILAATPDAVRVAMQKAIPDQYTPELADAIATGTITRLNALRTSACPVWPGLCTDTAPGHDTHSNHEMEATQTGWPVSIGFVGLDDGAPLVYVDSGMASDCGLDEVATVTAQLRAAADAMEALRDQVITVRQARRGPALDDSTG